MSNSTFNQKDAQDKFNSFTSYTAEDADKVMKNQQKIESIARDGTLSKYLGDIKLYFKMLGDVFTGKYKKVPVGTIAAIVGTLLYVLSPIDLIPDFIPVIGYLDDAFMFGLCLKACADDVEDYKKWKAMQSESVEQ